MEKKMTMPETSLSVAMSGLDISAGSPPRHLMNNGNIEPISVPHKQIHTTDKLAVTASGLTYSSGTPGL